MKPRLFAPFILLSTLLVFRSHAQTDSLRYYFSHPPTAAKPRVWWHWMNGNITQDGIRKDLVWMHKSGIGGFQNFDGALMTPPIVPKRLVYMTPEWKDAFALTAKIADSLKLEMAIAGSPGWSESGGPWVKPEDAMKKLVWSETRVNGGATAIKLPAPPSTTGPFQDMQNSEMSFGAGGDNHKKIPSYYKDVAVIAYRLHAHDKTMVDLKATVSSSAGKFTVEQLTDGILSQENLLPRDDATGFAWIQFSFPIPVTIKAVTMVGGGDRGPFGLMGEMKDTRWLESSNDGVNYTKIDFIPASRLPQQTISVTPTTAKYFRVVVKNPAANNMFSSFTGTTSKPPVGTEIAELVLHTAGRVSWSEEKSGYASDLGIPDKLSTETGDGIQLNDIINITDKLKSDGSLDWTVPQGQWNIIRYGYSLTGKENGPASEEATGLEVDKLDPNAINRYFTHYLNMYKDASKGLMGSKGGLQFMVNDSWEANTQNWTNNLPAEFKKRRGYEIWPWLPVVSGKIVGTAEQSDAFLRDFRRTLGDLVVEYHYDALTDLLNKYGMKRYTESHEDGTAMIADGMEVKRKAFVPMSAMWTVSGMGDNYKYQSDIRESASVAHIYGQNLVAAESLTALGMGGNAWAYVPSNLKPVADLELANGLNRFVIHTSVHQPLDDKIPGIGLGPFGQWFNRHDTWSGKAKAWTEYLSRSSFMLQQGKFVADILYYYGQDNNITGLYRFKLPEIPVGYNYDFINADALENLLSVKNGKFITPSGMSYRVLVLDSNARRMSLSVLRKIRDMVKQGGVIAGVRPETPFGLTDNREEFDRIVKEVWGDGTIHQSTRIGRVYADFNILKALEDQKIQQDFSYEGQTVNPDILYVHRTKGEKEIYWINNRTDKQRTIQASFRVTGKNVEIWHPETGRTEPASYLINNGQTTVSIDLTPNDAVFVIFDGKPTATSVVLKKKNEKIISTIEGAWTVHFQQNRGAPASSVFNSLSDFTQNDNDGIKYFSGTARYEKTFNLNLQELSSSKTIWLDLGEVKDLAEVYVNGKSAGIVWKTPFKIELTGLLKSGENKIEIEVVNRWVNRLIGDAQPNVQKKLTYTTMPFYNSKSPLVPSGLLGPVKLISVN